MATVPHDNWHRRVELHDGRVAILRPAVAADAQALIGAIDAVSRERRYFLRTSYKQNPEVEAEFIALLRRHGGRVLVAEVDGDVVGWLSLQRRTQAFRRHTAELGMGVLATLRGLGLGRALLQASFQWAEMLRIERLELSVRASNQRALALYHQVGFREEGRRLKAIKDDEGVYDDEILMSYAVALP